MIGSALPPCVNGVRVVDKGKQFPMYRFELWLSTSDQEEVKACREEFEGIIKRAGTWKKRVDGFDWKKHK